MSENNKVGIDITSTYSDKGSEQAKRDLRDLERETGRAGEAARDASRHHEAMNMAVSAGKVAIVGATLAAAGLAAVTVNLGSAWGRAAAHVGDLAERTQLSVEDLSLMRLEAEANQTSIDKLATGLKNLSVKMFEANSGNKQAQALFKALGIEYTDSTGRLRNARDVMDDVSTAFAGMSGEAEKSAIASKLLGRGIGEELVPYLNQGGEKLRDFRDEAEKLGLKMDTETVKAVKDLKDNINILKLSAEGAAGELAGPLFKSLVKITEAMRKAKAEGGWLWTLLRGGGAAADEFFTDDSQSGLQGKAQMFIGGISRDLGRLDEAKSPADRARIQQQLNDQYAGLDALYKRMGLNDAPPSGEPKPPAPSGITKEGNDKPGRARTGPKVMTFDELMAKAALKREQMYDEAERAADRDANRDADKRTKEAEREAEAMDKLARKYKDLIDPMQPLRRELGAIEKLFAAGKLTSDEYGEAMFNIQNRMEDLNGKAKEIKDDGLEGLKNAMHGWGRESSREIGRMVVDGEFNLKRLGNAFKNLAADIIASQVQKQWMDPLVAQGTKFLGNIFSGMFHDGGVVGAGGGARMVHPAYFERAPRYHRGGIAGDEVPAVLRRNEEVITRNDPRHRYNGGGMGKVRIEIVNQGQPQEVVSAQPGIDVDGMVIRIVTRDLQQGGPIRGSIESLMRPVN